MRYAKRRRSHREEKEEQLNFFQLARDSAIELEYYLLLCYELNMLDTVDYDRLVSGVVEVKQMLAFFIERLNPNSWKLNCWNCKCVSEAMIYLYRLLYYTGRDTTCSVPKKSCILLNWNLL